MYERECNTSVSVAGALFLQDVLKQNSTLTYLDVAFNRIYDEGAMHLAKGLQKNDTLHHLIVSQPQSMYYLSALKRT